MFPKFLWHRSDVFGNARQGGKEEFVSVMEISALRQCSAGKILVNTLKGIQRCSKPEFSWQMLLSLPSHSRAFHTCRPS